jgi:hypothetical protein
MPFRVLEGFPDSAHDDEVDACSGALEMLTQMKGWAIYEHYRRQAEAIAQSNAPPPPLDKPLTELTLDEENRRFAAITAVRRPTGNEVAEHEARLLELRNKSTTPPPLSVPTPQPTQSTWAIGSMEWLAEKNKSR